MKNIEKILSSFSDFMWGPALLFLLLGGGIFFTLYCRFTPFKYFKHGIEILFGKFDKETSILLDDLIKIVQRHKLINCIKPTISMLDDILAYEILDQKDLEDLSFGRSIKIDEVKLKKSQSKPLDKKLIFLSNKGDIVSIGKLIGNLFKPDKILI